MPVVTRRGALAEKSILNILPNELTTEIISLCNSTTQAALCRVSKLFQQLAHRPLYQIVSLKSKPAIISFEKVVSDIPQRAAWVRNLSIRYPFSVDVTQAKACDRILWSARETHRVSIEWWEGSMPDFVTFSFSELNILDLCGYQECDDSDQDIISSFINRHPTVSQLSALLFPPQFRTLVTLPKLTTYKGASMDLLSSHSTLRSVELVHAGSSTILDGLSRFPECQDVKIFLPDLTPTQDLQDVFQGIKQSLPHLKSLVLNSTFHLPSCINIVNEGLSGFKQLEAFKLLVAGAIPDVATGKFHDALVNVWFSICPTLKECVIELRHDSQVTHYNYRLAVYSED